MKKRNLFVLVTMVLFSVLAFGLVQAQDAVELRLTWYDDNPRESEALRAALDGFEADNPGITVTIDVIDYAEGILKTLPLQIQAGEGPDIARLTAFTSLTDYYLDITPYIEDADYWKSSFPEIILQAMRPAGDTEGIYGYPVQFTITGPFINRTLFEQAGIEVPSDSNDAVTWAEWTEAAKQVAEATETPYAIAMDRSGHRFAGPAISDGATFFDADGKVTIDSPGFRSMAEALIGWHTDGVTPAEVWAGNSGNYAPATDFFLNGQVVFYMAGSWQIGNFDANIGDKFDWEAVPNPSGPGGSTGMPGGAVVMALKETEHPEAVAKVMDYLVREDVLAEFSAKTLFIPGHLGLVESGVDYDTENPFAAQSLNAFLAQLPNIAEDAYKLNFHPQNSAVFNTIRDRLGQVLNGELTLDDAIVRMQQEADDAIAAAGG